MEGAGEEKPGEVGQEKRDKKALKLNLKSSRAKGGHQDDCSLLAAKHPATLAAQLVILTPNTAFGEVSELYKGG